MTAQRKAEELYPRAPRYIIELGDNQIVRFAMMPKGSKAMHTRIINVSESGMAFLTPFLSAPALGEVIKVEFTAPNAQPIACYADVKRIQTHRTYSNDRTPQTFKLVAVEFKNMHPKQRQLLAQGLNKQFLFKESQYKRQQFLLKVQWGLIRAVSGMASFFSNIISKKNNLKNKE